MASEVQVTERKRRRQTHSEREAYRACPELRHLAYKMRYRAVRPAKALMFGTVWHKMLEVYWHARRLGLDTDACLRKMLREVPRDGDPYTAAMLTAMAIGYAAVWKGREVEVLHIELEYTVPMIHPLTGVRHELYDNAGKMDAVLRVKWDSSSYRTSIVEHKTSSTPASPTSIYRQRLEFDHQISEYIAAGDALGLDAGDVLYDVAVKPKIRPLNSTPVEKQRFKTDKKTGVKTLFAKHRATDETPREYFARLVKVIAKDPKYYFQLVRIQRPDDEKEEYRFDVWQLARLIRESDEEGLHPKNRSSCYRFKDPCPFLRVCNKTASLDDKSLFRVAATEHEELGNRPGDDGASVEDASADPNEDT